MCLPSELVLVATVAAGEELVLVVYHLILLLKAHSRNLRHNNIEHREIVGSSPFFLYGGTVDCLSFFYVCAVFSFFLLSRTHNRGVLDVCKHMFHTICITLFLSPGVYSFFWFVVLYHTEV
jgi:hypothetical protein